MIKLKGEIIGRVYGIVKYPQKIGVYDKAINFLGDANIHTIFSFVKEMAKLRKSNKYSEAFFLEYTHDLFDGEKNKDIWEQINSYFDFF